MSENLKTAPLDCFADVVMGQSPDSAFVNSDEVGLPFLQGCAEFGRQSPQANLYCSPPLRVAPSQSVLVSVRAPVGKSNWADQSYCIGRGLGAFKAKSGQADTHFLHYALGHNVAHLHRRSQGSTFSAIGGEDLKKFPVPAFDFAIQSKIANILQTMDEAIEQTEALIEKYSLIKAGMMHDLFTRGLTPDGKLRPPREEAPDIYKETPIGWIPKEWAVEIIKSCFGAQNIVNGPFGSDLLKSELKQEGVPVLYVQDVKPGVFHRVSKVNVTLQKAAQLSFCNVRKGDILLAKVGSPPCDSCVYENDDHAIVTQDVIRIRTGQKLDPLFFSSLFNSNFGRKSIRRIAIEGTRERVSLGDFKSLFVPVPLEDEQKLISERLRLVQSLISKEKEMRAKLKIEKSGLMRDLLSGEVPVTVNDPEAAHV